MRRFARIRGAKKWLMCPIIKTEFHQLEQGQDKAFSLPQWKMKQQSQGKYGFYCQV